MKATISRAGRAVRVGRPTRARRVLWSFVATIALSGCGFHLQGDSPLPPDIGAMGVTYSSRYRVGDPPLVTTLRQRLRERGLLGAAGASAQLYIHSIDNQQRVLSVSPIDGDVAEYALTTQVVFDYRVNDAPRMANQTLSVTRDYSFNDTQRLATESERRDLLTAMQKELAHLVLLRIAEVDHRVTNGHATKGHAVNDHKASAQPMNQDANAS